tara:strand:- start:2630 stop:4366 length:1737 start_codon:yes stop_codon:yes gene_type:complete
MENSFISKQNIENIYSNINVFFVKNHQFNLDSESKYKKIVKKMSKTIFNSIKHKDQYQNIVVNQFNDIVLNKSVDFLLNDIQKNNTVNKHTTQPSNSNMIKQSQSVLYDSTILEPKKKQKKSKKNKFNPNIFDSFTESQSDVSNLNNYIDNLDNFDIQVKKANKKIKDNFEKFVMDKDDNFIKDDHSEFIIDRCASQDAANDFYKPNTKSNKNAFEQILENKIDNNLNESTESVYSNNISNDYSNSNNVNDVYNNNGISDLISKITLKQNDNSKGNELESYEGESYLPNLIPSLGEEAPIQPLIYQNSGTGTERINKKVITIDSGICTIAGGILTPVLNESVTNNGSNTNSWHQFKVDLQDTIKIDKLCDVYLRNVIVNGITHNLNCNYLVIDIDEFNIRNYSNNPSMRNKINVLNTIAKTNQSSALITINTNVANVTAAGATTITLVNVTNLLVGMSVSGIGIPNNTIITNIANPNITINNAVTQEIAVSTPLYFYSEYVLNVNYPSNSNYITTINPSKIDILTFTITNQDNEHVDNDNMNTFAYQSRPNNRIIMELEFKSRLDNDEMIYEQGMYSN